MLYFFTRYHTFVGPWFKRTLNLLCVYMKGRILSMCLIFLSLAVSHAQESLSSDTATSEESVITEKFAIYYRFDDIDFDQTYLTNRESAEHIRNYLINSPRIDSITIYSWASPEGAYHHNVWLSKERAKTAKRFLLSHSPDSAKLNSGKIHISPLAENWPGLLALVEENYHRHDRAKVLTILGDRTIGDETRKWRLKQLDNGYTWNYLWRNYMPHLRAATWVCVWAEVIDPLPQVAQARETLYHDAGMIHVDAPVPTPQPQTRTIAALKTNLLFDAVTAVNYALEIPVGNDFSVQFQQYTPWWVTKSNRQCLQFLSLGAEVRWWFKSDEVLQGHFVGANAWSGNGDLQWNKNICYQFEFWSAGLTYGYSMPVSKWANLEFSISAGYAQIPYQHYIPTDDWQILIKDKSKAGTLHYFGPTKAEVSLVIPIKATFIKGGAR